MNIALKCISHTYERCLRSKYLTYESYVKNLQLLIFSKDIKIVPILVGAINKNKEEFFGELLAPYFAEQDTICVVSSDFCHWYGMVLTQYETQFALLLI